MLILTRKRGEVIRIGDDISVTYLGRDDNQRQAYFTIEERLTPKRVRRSQMALYQQEEGFIRPDIWLVAIHVKATDVRVGVEAPREVPVHRQEIYERIQREVADATRHP